MAAQKGSDMLLKIDTASSGGPTFTTVGGIQSKSMTIKDDFVDVSNQDSTNKWREGLAGASIISMSVSGSGVAKGDAGYAAARAALLSRSIKQWQVIVPGDGTYQGLFQIVSLDRQGQHEKEVSFDIRLESAGEITFTAA